MSAAKLRKAWCLFAPFSIPSVSCTPSERRSSSTRLRASSNDIQKLISCAAESKSASLVSFVMACMALIQLLTLFCTLLITTVFSRISCGIDGRFPSASASAIAARTTSCSGSCTIGISVFCCKCKRLISNSAMRRFAPGTPVFASGSVRDLVLSAMSRLRM